VALGGFVHHLGPASFFQINPAAAEEILRWTLELAGGGERCVEGYAGVGALTLPLSDQFAHVTAVESNPSAVEAMRRAVGRYHREAVIDAVCADAEAYLPELLASAAPDAVVVDPPRKGLGEAICSALVACTARRMVFVSCDPRALARDLPVLGEGGWVIERVVPVDQFPRTGHVEAVVGLRR
jgi:23S rRNA (uracil1939-C5)-methyltransferase